VPEGVFRVISPKRSGMNQDLPWLRWWDSAGKLLLTGEERAEKLAAKLRELGVDPDEL
jgi:hypothetical protein